MTVAVAVGFGLARPGFLGADNLLDIGQQSAVIAIVAFAMTAVIVARGIDISVGGALAASGMLAGTAYEHGLAAGGRACWSPSAAAPRSGRSTACSSASSASARSWRRSPRWRSRSGLTLCISGGDSIPIDEPDA